jgi:hypothetical protein
MLCHARDSLQLLLLLQERMSHVPTRALLCLYVCGIKHLRHSVTISTRFGDFSNLNKEWNYYEKNSLWASEAVASYLQFQTISRNIRRNIHKVGRKWLNAAWRELYTSDATLKAWRTSGPALWEMPSLFRTPGLWFRTARSDAITTATSILDHLLDHTTVSAWLSNLGWFQRYFTSLTFEHCFLSKICADFQPEQPPPPPPPMAPLYIYSGNHHFRWQPLTIISVKRFEPSSQENNWCSSWRSETPEESHYVTVSSTGHSKRTQYR